MVSSEPAGEVAGLIGKPGRFEARFNAKRESPHLRRTRQQGSTETQFRRPGLASFGI